MIIIFIHSVNIIKSLLYAYTVLGNVEKIDSHLRQTFCLQEFKAFREGEDKNS